jgi:Beta-lactamase enzyme family
MGDSNRADAAAAADATPASVRFEPGDLGDDERLIEAWARSRANAQERRAVARSQRRHKRLRLGGGALLVAAIVAGAAGLVFPALDLGERESARGANAGRGIVLGGDGVERAEARRPEQGAPSARATTRRPAIVPAPGTLNDAWRFAQARGGEISIAVVDTRGRLRGEDENRLYSSASVVKSMLLAAELRRLQREGLPLDAQTESLLRAMITYSDNDAADAIYSRVGDAGLFEVAHLARMNRFTVAGHWGNAQITAADMARMFSDLDRLFTGPRREFGLGLLGSIIPEQSWGIPAAAGRDWAVRFKGGWVTTERGQLAHQAAELRDDRNLIAMAVLTDYQPSMSYATETVRGVAERLLDTRPAGKDR